MEVWGAAQLERLVAAGRARLPEQVAWAADALLATACADEALDRMWAAGSTALIVDFGSLGAPADSRALRLAGLVKQLRRRGFVVHGRFTLGLDHDDAGSFERLVTWVEAVGLARVELRLWTPEPGSPELAELASADRVRHQQLERWDGAHVVIVPKQMSAETLYRGWAWARRRLASLASIWARRPRDPAGLLAFVRAWVAGPARSAWTPRSRLRAGLDSAHARVQSRVRGLRSTRLRARARLVAS
jgi:hypothetical protein